MEYKIEDTGGGTSDITTIQRVIGVSHADTIAFLQTTYRLKDGNYRAEKISLVDVAGLVLAEKTLQ